MAALLNRSLIVKGCAFSQRWRTICSNSVSIRFNYGHSCEDYGCKASIDSSIESLFLKEMARRMTAPVLNSDQKPYNYWSNSCPTLKLNEKNTFCSHLFNRFKYNSSNITSVRHIHRSAVVFDEIKEVVVPPLAESLSEGDIRWDKAVGDSVAEDEVVGEVETDKIFDQTV